jgi:hypothetical protein
MKLNQIIISKEINYMQINYDYGKILSNNELLRERIGYGFAQYKAKTEQLEGSEILILADQIALVTEIHAFMTEDNDWVSEDDAESLLRFENPLLMLASEWQNYKLLFGAEFADFINDLMTVPDSGQDAPTEQAHDSEVPILISVLSEMVDVCTRLHKFIDSKAKTSRDKGKGGGFWSEG